MDLNSNTHWEKIFIILLGLSNIKSMKNKFRMTAVVLLILTDMLPLYWLTSTEVVSPGCSPNREGPTAKGGCSEKYVLDADFRKEKKVKLMLIIRFDTTIFYVLDVFWMNQRIDFYPKVWVRPLVLGGDVEHPRTESHILALKLNKLHSSNQTVSTVQSSWNCTRSRPR